MTITTVNLRTVSSQGCPVLSYYSYVNFSLLVSLNPATTNALPISITLRTFKKFSHTVIYCVLTLDFFFLSINLTRLSQVYFFLICSITCNGYTTDGLTIHLSNNIWVAFIWGAMINRAAMSLCLRFLC